MADGSLSSRFISSKWPYLVNSSLSWLTVNGRVRFVMCRTFDGGLDDDEGVVVFSDLRLDESSVLGGMWVSVLVDVVCVVPLVFNASSYISSFCSCLI